MRKYVFLVGLMTFLGFSLCWKPLHGQRPQTYHDKEQIVLQVRDLMDLEQYTAAQALCREQLIQPQGLSEHALAQFRFFEAVAATYLFQMDAEVLLMRFIDLHPQVPQVAQAYFHLGKIHFRNKDWDQAIYAFSKADVFLLAKDEYVEFYFKQGYAQYMASQSDAALNSFAQVTPRVSPWNAPAHYYSGQIYYERENFQTALDYFLKVSGDKTFSRIVPFYIVQIYFRQEKYAEVLSYGEVLADTLKGPQKPRVQRIMAESAFFLKQYPTALNWYEKYENGGGQLDREGFYRMGLAYYQTAQYQEAATRLRQTTSEDDKLTQSTYFYLADCFIKLGTKRLALDALRLAAASDFDPDLSREALYHFAKLSYELGLNPYNEAVEALEAYLKRFPQAPNKQEARELMVQIYMSAKNYKDALASLETMPDKNPRLRLAYQRILYFRGIELYNNLDHDLASQHFSRAIQENFDPVITAEARYWLGEVRFKQKDFQAARQEWEAFLGTPTARKFPHYGNAWYNLGFARLKLRDYQGAISDFRAYLEKYGQKDAFKTSDAQLRIADAYFMMKNFDKSLEFYQRAAKGQFQVDYALFQSGILFGLTGQYKEKVDALRQLSSRFPQSPLAQEGVFETGKALIRDGRPLEAIPIFEKLLTDAPKGNFTSRTYLELGLIYYNAENDAQALGWLKRVADEYPKTPQSQEALKYIQSIYTNAGRIDDWLSFVRAQGGEVGQSTLDSGAYFAVLQAIQAKDCLRIHQAGEAYVRNFPNGAGKWNTLHHRADCYFDAEKDEEALKMYELLIAAGPGAYYENALVKAGYIYSEAKQDEQTLRVYTELEKTAGSTEVLLRCRDQLMRAHFRQSNWASSIEYAKKVLTFEKLPPAIEEEAHMTLARGYLKLGEDENSLAFSRKISTNSGSAYAAEAAYMIGDILYRKGEYKQAERELRKAIKTMGSYRDWMARSFILLSDVYVAMEDFVQAKSVLKTVIDRHDGADLVQVAKDKFEAIETLERNRNRRQFEESMDLELQPE